MYIVLELKKKMHSSTNKYVCECRIQNSDEFHYVPMGCNIQVTVRFYMDQCDACDVAISNF